MQTHGPTRREFVATWLALPWLAALAACARDDARADAPFARLTRVEARTLRALAARVIPAVDGVPGADEAGAAHFVDRALGTPAFAADLPLLRDGLAALTELDFASLPTARQDEILVGIESGPFFDTARTLVVIGTLADPVHGGNRGGAGWQLVGIDRRPSYDAPFGWYDAPRDVR